MPSLEWEENLFLGLKSLYKSVMISPREKAIRARQVELSEHRSMLTLLAKIISGSDVKIFETDDAILYVGDRICLPKRAFIARDSGFNLEYYILRIVVAAVAIRFKLHSQIATDASLLEHCAREFPYFSQRLSSLREQLVAGFGPDKLFPRLPTRAELDAIGDKSIISTEGGELDVSGAITEIEGQGRVDVVDVTEGSSAEQETPFHTFEKAETLDEYNGLSRQNDAEDELQDHEEALQQLKMDSVIRTSDRSQSVYKADIMLDGIGFEFQGSVQRGIPYPEWDYRRKRYREQWCFVQEDNLLQSDVAWSHDTQAKHRSLIVTLKKRFSALASEWLRTKRQPTGSDFDLDAIVEFLVRLRTNEAAPENLYLSANRQLPDIATLILIDSSYSTDSWIENRCVMDVMKETVFCMAEVLEDAKQQLGIFAFSSNTRQSCKITVMKEFSDQWLKARDKLGALSPIGYTRIGPALRHAYRKLEDVKAEKKLILLITDGKPCDYDRYEGRYGIEDVRKAIAEGESKDIMTHAFAIDKQARDYYPTMFSKSNYDIVAHPSRLIEALFQLYLRVCLKK